MLPIPPILPFFPIPGYAETHYRFRFLPSYLKKNEPEVVFDAPHRVDPEGAVPIVLLVKDAHLFPATIESATAVVRSSGQEVVSRTLIHQPIRLSEEWWWTIYDLDVGGATGWLECEVRFSLSRNGRSHSYTAHNYRTASAGPLRVYRSASPLPSLPGFISGEAHSHSRFTSDQVEFGLPLRPTRYLARRLGLGFVCVTDHSYDLDDAADSYLVNDPSLPKWNEFLREVEELNGEPGGPVLVCGEEVTVRNADGRNVHCLVYGDRTFHPGAGDSAERWMRTRSELSIEDLATRLYAGAGMFAAHIAEHVPFLQRYLLGRGRWAATDMSHRRLDGVQFWNGSADKAMETGKRMWVQNLLGGVRTTAIAGNDAHGNFNRFLQLRIPFLLMQSADKQLFGRVRTSAFLTEIGERTVLDALRSGRSFMTDGPACAVYGTDGRMMLGDTVPQGATLVLRAGSTGEFGELGTVQVLSGTRGAPEEVPLARWKPGGLSFHSPAFTVPESCSYLRAEVTTRPGDAYGRPHRALTNPVWCSADG